ncbi:hypothetical protein HLH34_04205 [Gluconacetobacter azotocaptans]|uniref:Uncharacterized protein n=1 Tax=Gluconacetobacter azotocaptans TaxID=142834 RepID=A0A7W4PFR2_9PROT|nr:hypothetical protein [Gluconacetobacter azotocaptans]MBB2189166.1 hypothetical protein [Gluconacetobacter azotocaptans]GBQ32124.1 hypothetical protein AA13594_2275 [Gluconacetobacter azotocaptans DSM 13594]
MPDNPLPSHSCLSDLVIGQAAYTTRLYGDGKGAYVGATREDGGACAIAHVGRLVTIDGQCVLELTGYLTTPARGEGEANG